MGMLLNNLCLRRAVALPELSKDSIFIFQERSGRQSDSLYFCGIGSTACVPFLIGVHTISSTLYPDLTGVREILSRYENEDRTHSIKIIVI